MMYYFIILGLEALDMSGQEFSLEMKRLFFRVITFIESEKYGPRIPLYNTFERIQTCLGISIRSISTVKLNWFPPLISSLFLLLYFIIY